MGPNSPVRNREGSVGQPPFESGWIGPHPHRIRYNRNERSTGQPILGALPTQTLFPSPKNTEWERGRIDAAFCVDPFRNNEFPVPAAFWHMKRSNTSLRVQVKPIIAVLITSSVILGCHRQFYRKQADCEVNYLLDEKAADVARPPNVALRIDIDRRSRMFNPFDLDFQPMPLDDPASYELMQCVDGRRGYPMWEAAGITNMAENPDWWQFLPLNEDGVLVLNQENSVKIALLNSNQYQQQLEDLYFAALAVSAQRFEFETQFFGGADSVFETSRGGPSSLTLGDRNVSLSRRFATGADLLVGVANQIVWDLGGDSGIGTSLINFSFLQPLLRAAGRDVVMENLTQAERELLASVRSFERYRRSFYLNITVGARAELVAQTSVGNISISPGGVGGSGNADGYIGLLQSQLQIRNSEENIARQTENLLILEDSLIELLTTIPDDAESIVRQRLQVAQTRASVLRSQGNLINQQAGYQRSVDSFLRTLGLPPYICVKLDDPILDRFELIDRKLLTRREELSALRANVGGINVSILESAEFKLDPDTGLPVSNIEWTPQLATALQSLQDELEPLEAFTKDLIEQDLPIITRDIQALTQALPERRRQNKSLKELYKTEEESICGLLNLTELDESVFDIQELDGLETELNEEFAKLEARLNDYLMRIRDLQAAFEKLQAEGQTSNPIELARRLRDDIILASQDLVAELGDDVLLLQLIQARARTESVLLPEVDISPEVAFEIARRNRRDWANARASLVDSWRQIEVVADQLESRLDFVVNGSVDDGDNGNLSVALQWDAPITRLLERNNYRRQLILYEQAKRRYYNYEDSIWQSLRAEVRQLQANRLRFELGRQSVGIAAEQIELNADIRALNDARGRSAGPTAARDAISALNDLLDAQNGLLGIFVNYEVVRRGLDLDLGTMELTPEGLWIDPGKISPETLLALPGTTAVGMIECECNDCGMAYNPLPMEPIFNPPMFEGEINEGQSVLSDETIMSGEMMMDIEPIDSQTLPSNSPPPEALKDGELEKADAIELPELPDTGMTLPTGAAFGALPI